MAFNANDTFTLDLSVFGSLVKDLAPANLPAGASPDNADCFYGAQYVATRPAWLKVLEASMGAGDILSHLDFPQPTGETLTMALYSDGSLWSRNVQTNVATQLGSVTPGVRFKAIAAFDKFFMTFRGLSLTSPFTSAQLAGGDVPRYVNSLGHMWRLTSDAPGGGLSVTGVNIGPEDLVTPASFVFGPHVTSIVFSGLVPGTPTSYYTTATVTLASAQSLTAGQSVQIYGIPWANPGGPQFPSGVQIQSVTSSTIFVIPIVPTAAYNHSVSGSPPEYGTFAYAGGGATLARQNNIVTAYLEGTSPSTPTAIQQGWFVVLSDADPAATVGSVPDGTAPFIKNELFQAIFPSTQGGGNSVALLSGGTLRYYQGSPKPGAPFAYNYPGDGSNIPLPSPAATVPMQANWGICFNPYPMSFLPGVSDNLYTNTPMQAFGISPTGVWDGTKVTPGGYIPHDVGDWSEANWDMVQTGSLYIASAGTITFKCSSNDAVIIGIGGAAVAGGGNPMVNHSTSGQTKTALMGYPIMMMENVDQGEHDTGSIVSTFTVTFPSAGVYPIEFDFAVHVDARCLVLNWMDGATQKAIIPSAGSSTAVAKVQGDGTGNIHVTLPTSINNLPIGSWLYLYLYPSVPSAVSTWVQTAAGVGIINVSNANWTVGTEIQLNGFTGSSQPTTWNGVVVTITAVEGTSYQFNFAATTSSSGSTATGTATPVSASYPSGWVQVTQVPSSSEFVFYAVGNTSIVAATGMVYDYFGSLNTSQSLTAPIAGQATAPNSSSGIVQGFQVLSVDTTTTPNKITWYQSGFDDLYSGTHVLQVQPNSQVAGGPRSAVVFFINEDGGATPASYPLLVQLNGGSQYPNVSLPLGPPGTVSRGVGFTTAYGAEYYVLGKSTQPLTASGGPIINLGTIVPDNTTAELIMDFSDAALVNGIPIGPGAAALGSDFGDLTSTIVLPPCLGVLEYEASLVFWGELNCLPNHSMFNMGFDGGYNPNAGSTSTGPNTAQSGVNSGGGSAWVNPNNVSSSSTAATVQTGPVGPTFPAPTTWEEVPMPIMQTSVGAHPRPWDGGNVVDHPGNIVTVYYNDIHERPGPDPNIISAFASPAGAYVVMSGCSHSAWNGMQKITAYGADKPYHDTEDTHNWFQFICGGPALGVFTVDAGARYQQVSPPMETFSQKLLATNTGFSLGSQGAVAGIGISFYLKALFNTAVVTVQLLKNGVPIGTAKTVNATTSNTHVTLGNSGDMWSTTLTTTDINNNGFGVQISVVDTSSNINTTSVYKVQASIYGAGGGMSEAMPLGWDATTPYNGITPDGAGRLVVSPNGLGFAYEMASGSAHRNNCMLSQGAYQDFYGKPILLPNRSYLMRFEATLISGTPTGNLDFVFYSPSVGVLGTAEVSLADLTSQEAWQTAFFTIRDPNVGFTNWVAENGTTISPSPTGTLTPETTSDYAVIVANDGIANVPAGWSSVGFSTWTKQLSSAAPISFADLGIYDAGVGSWANVLASFPTAGAVSRLQYTSFGSGGFGPGPHSQSFGVDVTEGSAIMAFISADCPGTPVGPLTMEDSRGNIYQVAYSQVTVPYGGGSYTVGAWVWIAYNVPAGPLTLTWTAPVGAGNINGGGAYELTNIATPVVHGPLAQMPVTIPSDTVFYLKLDGTATTDFVIDIDELEIIDAKQPVLSHQLRVSYPDNEFGYDNENGYVIGLDTTDFIASAFVQRNYLYVNTENELHTVQNTASLPSQWATALHAKECGSSGPDAVCTGRSTSWWMGRHGLQMFDGGQPKKINQYVVQDFDKTNWDAAVNSCCGHDAVQQVMYWSWPTGDAIDPNIAYTMSFRLSDSAVNVPDPVHVSAYTGRLIATDLGMKWSPLRRPINSIQMSTQQTPQGVAKVMTFAGAGFGQLYMQDFQNYPPVTGDFSTWNCSDADYGQIFSYYQTYFFFSHDTEQQPQLALYRKLFAYMAFHCVGLGDLVITPYVDAMNTPWTPLPTYPLGLADPGFDYDIGVNVTGNRCSFKFEVFPALDSPPGTSAAFMLTHMIVSARKDNVFPVRGSL